MEKLTEVLAPFFYMGSYGLYVWPAFGTAAVVLVAMLVVSLRALKRANARLLRLQEADSGQ